MSFFYVLLLFIPVSIFLEMRHASPLLVFITAGIAIIPLAGYLGEATEEIALYTGPRIGGLLNATFGNAAELIITLFAIKAGLYDIVKASITGSIVGNILLVLGFSVFLGGLKYKEQRFNRIAANTSSTMLFLTATSLAVPAIFAHSTNASAEMINHMSLGVAIVLAVVYILGLLFSLHTHREIFEVGKHAEKPTWSRGKAVLILLVSTVFVALESEILVSSIESVVALVELSPMFIGVIIIPIIGNAAEHSTAIMMALKNKIDLSFDIAIGSSAQIALFVAPVLVFLSFIIGNPMNLIFTPFELAAIAMAVIIASLISLDGRSNWLEGVQLIAAYVIIALAFFFIPL